MVKSRYNRAHAVASAVMFAAVSACVTESRPPSHAEAADTVAAVEGEAASQRAVRESAVGATVARPDRQPSLSPPRRRASHGLRALWTAGGPSDPGRIIQPMAIIASRLGVLVSDLDGAHIRVFDSQSGIQVDTIGGYGLGPGEFGRVPFLLGTYNDPLAFEGPNGRISLLGRDSIPLTLRVAVGRLWLSACQTSPGRVLIQATGGNRDGYFTSTIGIDAALVDSFPHPIPSLQSVLPLARQARLFQADDSTCVVLPRYAHEFAFVRDDEVVLGASIEPVPTPRAEWSGVVGRSTLSLSRDTRSAQLGAASWRGRLLILYAGATAYRRRLVDIYDSGGTYEGSLVLPYISGSIATSGDTLFVLGERDDEPILAAFLLRPH